MDPVTAPVPAVLLKRLDMVAVEFESEKSSISGVPAAVLPSVGTDIVLAPPLTASIPVDNESTTPALPVTLVGALIRTALKVLLVASVGCTKAKSIFTVAPAGIRLMLLLKLLARV